MDRDENTAYYLNSRRDDVNTAKKNILAELSAKLIEYGK